MDKKITFPEPPPDWGEVTGAVIGDVEVSVKTDGTRSYVTAFEQNYFDLLEALRKKDAEITIKAMDVNGAWVASADVPVTAFKREYGVFSFSNTEQIVFQPVADKEVCILLLGLFYEGKLKLTISCDAEVNVSIGYTLSLLPGDLRINC